MTTYRNLDCEECGDAISAESWQRQIGTGEAMIIPEGVRTIYHCGCEIGESVYWIYSKSPTLK